MMQKIRCVEVGFIRDGCKLSTVSNPVASIESCIIITASSFYPKEEQIRDPTDAVHDDDFIDETRIQNVELSTKGLLPSKELYKASRFSLCRLHSYFLPTFFIILRTDVSQATQKKPICHEIQA
mmetsp:Transcript_30273/g.72607  ORF Transcript_30273/g.72607 Transcript_30273/m.72607 type:complete len:124 (-) Transcript_30273:465-836(-)